MQKPSRKHHYVPQFYLAGFTPSGQKDDFIWVLDQKEIKQWQAKVQNIAFQNDFYTVDIPDTEPDSIEKAFSTLERQAAKVIREMSINKVLPKDENYNILMNFIALLIVRVPKARKTYEDPMVEVLKRTHELILASPERYQATMERLKKEGYDVADVSYETMLEFEKEEKYNIKFDNVFHVQNVLIALDAVLPCLVSRNWILLETEKSEDEFICSDSPVSLYWTKPVETINSPGFGMEGTDVIFPVNKNLLLLGRFENLKNFAIMSRKSVALFNSYTSMHAMRYLFSANKHFIYLNQKGKISDSKELLKRIQERNKKEMK